MGKLRGWVFIFILSLVPVMIWSLMMPLARRFINFNMIMTSLGQLTALVGLVLFSITMLLNTRLKFLEEHFGGLNQVYAAHHWLGIISFVLLLFHPIFLASRLIVSSFKDALFFLLPSSDIAINTGIFALLAMMLFLIFTFLIKLEYQRWKFTHKFLGLAFLIATVHILLIPSDITQKSLLSFILRQYMIFFLVLGILSYFYRTILPRFFVKKHHFTITEVKRLDESITEVALDQVKGEKKFSFVPGQFVFISFNDKNLPGEWHPFSIVSAKDEGRLRLNIKNLGDFTSKIKDLSVGSNATVEGPYGRMNSSLYGESQIWIAGGIGITPFLSMARSKPIQKIDFYYCVKTKEEGIFFKELDELAKKNKNIRSFPFCTDEKGRISADYVSKNSNGVDGKDIFICGPPGMIKSLTDQFRKMNVPKSKIIKEEFGLL